ncbi:hypothetical protein V1523DRAFT_425544 [Lipomyces doorenjongii]
MHLAKTIAILQCSGRGTKATIVECMIADGGEYYDFERIIETWHSEKRSGIRVDLSLRHTEEISTRYQEELATEPSYSDNFSRSTGVASNPVQIMASIKIGHATIHSLPSSSSIDPLPARGINNPGYADHPLAHTPSPEPYPQLPPQYQSAPYPALQANYYYPFLAPNYSAIPVPAQDAAPTSFSGATPATANITTEVKDGCSGYCTKEKGI